MDSLAHLKAIKEIQECQVCQKPGTCVMHLIHLGMGSNRKKPNILHLITTKGCDSCHDLYDGRTTSKISGWLSFKGKTGVDVFKIALGNIMRLHGITWKDVVRGVIYYLTDERP